MMHGWEVRPGGKPGVRLAAREYPPRKCGNPECSTVIHPKVANTKTCEAKECKKWQAREQQRRFQENKKKAKRSSK